MNKLIPSVMLLLLLGCSQNFPATNTHTREETTPTSTVQREIVVGGLYSFKGDDGKYDVMKVLVVDDFAVHLRLYANRFEALPTDIDPAVLSLGSIEDEGGFGIGHFPLDKERFWDDNPVFLKTTPVTDDELEGYRIYLEAIDDYS